MRLYTGIVVPPDPFRRGDPPDKNAELTVYDLGPNPADALFALSELGEWEGAAQRRFEGSMPVEAVLPGVYYDNENAHVARLRATGCRFEIRTYAWLCPSEIKDDNHWCGPTCSVTRVVEALP